MVLAKQPFAALASVRAPSALPAEPPAVFVETVVRPVLEGPGVLSLARAGTGASSTSTFVGLKSAELEVGAGRVVDLFAGVIDVLHADPLADDLAATSQVALSNFDAHLEFDDEQR